MPKSNSPFTYNIVRIQDCGFSFQELANPDMSTARVGFGVNFNFDVKTNLIEFVVSAQFKEKDEDVISFLSGVVLTSFKVSNLKSFEDSTGTVQFPDGVLETLFGISFSHLRAILAKNSAGSKFGNILIPIINPNEVFHGILAAQGQQKMSTKK